MAEHRNRSASGSIKPAYLIAGSDEGKIDAALTRLRARAEREGGAGVLESFGLGRPRARPTPTRSWPRSRRCR